MMIARAGRRLPCIWSKHREALSAHVRSPTGQMIRSFTGVPDGRGPKGEGVLKTAFNRLAKAFGMDRQSIERRQRRREAEAAIDRVFEGTGLMGGLLGGIIKRLGRLVARWMEESAADLSIIQDRVVSSLTADSACSSYLGEDIACGASFQSSSSSSSINGVVNKYYACVMQVKGSRGSGRVRVRASTGSNGFIRIKEIMFESSDGRLIMVPPQ